MVDWKRVNKAPVPSKFKRVENTNYALALGQQLNFTLVAIQGSDITDGVKTLTLGFVWQLMREHVIQTLKILSKDGREVTDADIINWANTTVRRGGRANAMASFLMNGLKRGVVDYEMVSTHASDEDCKMNAKYAISIARKLGATIFVLPEDIVEVKPKMVRLFDVYCLDYDVCRNINGFGQIWSYSRRRMRFSNKIKSDLRGARVTE
jgi:plastin-1